MKSKGYANGGKLKMVKNKDGEEVPFFAADGEGKMKAGGMVPKTKGYFKGGKTKGYARGGRSGEGGTPVRHHAKPFPSKRGVGAPPRVPRGGKG